jgi:hypothetical protein
MNFDLRWLDLRWLDLRWLRLLEAGCFGALFVCLTVMFRAWMRVYETRRRRWRKQRFDLRVIKPHLWPGWLLAVLFMRDSSAKQERSQLLAAAGIPVSIFSYELGRRLAGLFFGVIGAWGIAAVYIQTIPSPAQPAFMTAFAISFLLPVCFDKVVLQTLRKQRTTRIMGEIYVLSNHLLYYSGSQMNLHSKLLRSVPYTRSIRKELSLMLGEWYHNAEEAIRRFKARLGTDEAYSFAETIRSLRLNESPEYYDLLRERIRDYKEKMELARDSKKETTSYVLFVIAGIPILNTFRVFVYPWVMEGQKLFNSLN